MPTCSTCKQPKNNFSKTQLKRKGKRVCTDCINRSQTTNKIIIDNETQTYDDQEPNPFRDLIEQHNRKRANGRPHCVVCGETNIETQLIYVKSANKNFCASCWRVQIEM